MLTFLQLLRCMCDAYIQHQSILRYLVSGTNQLITTENIFFVYHQERRKCNLAPPSRIYHHNIPYSLLGWIVNTFLRTTFTYDKLQAPPLLLGTPGTDKRYKMCRGESLGRKLWTITHNVTFSSSVKIELFNNNLTILMLNILTISNIHHWWLGLFEIQLIWRTCVWTRYTFKYKIEVCLQIFSKFSTFNKKEKSSI